MPVVGLRQLPALFVRVLFVVVLAMAAGMVLSGRAFAAPIAQAEVGDIRLVLTDEPCALEAVSNLPRRAVWHQGGKIFEGCWNGHPQVQVVMCYFADKSVVVVPLQMFVRLQGG